MDTSQPEDQLAYIENLQRDYLIDSVPQAVQLDSLLSHLHWIRVQAVSRFWNTETVLHDTSLFLRRFLTGVWGSGATIGYMVTGEAGEIAVYLGKVLQGPKPVLSESLPMLLDQFQGFFPGVEPGRAPGAWSLVTNYVGIVSGIPSVLEPDNIAAGETQPNWIARTMRGCQRWGYTVLALPRPVHYPLQLLREAARQQREIARSVNRTLQWAEGVTVTPSGGLGEELIAVIEQHRERCRTAAGTGMWQVQVIFFADTDTNRRRLGTTLLGAFGGPQSQPQPLRIHYAHPNGNTGIQHYSTDLTSEELAYLITLPAVEMPGFRIKPYARFDLVPGSAKSPSIAIGQIVDANLAQDGVRATATERGSVCPSYEFRIGRNELAQHALICGVTGGGKTNTCFVLLDGLAAGSAPLPFLVIEPAKAEYRALSSRSRPVRVFTLGEERVAPFRLNPFWFDTSHGEHSVHIQTHVDHLKAVFNAAFVLYAPMPYVLEICLHEIYQDKGWNFTTSVNTRFPAQQSVPAEAFPTLSDLDAKIGEVVDRLGYEQRISMDIKAALQTRVGSLCLGAKGLMLNTYASVGIEDLLSQPTIIEMEHIGNDEEKAFLMGLLLANLYAYRRAQARAKAARCESLPKLQHVTAIEEAHRLLAQVPLEQGTEIANVRGHAVATFVNMISEMRAFGEGIVIAEQIPTRLATDVVKNTNLKFMHRLLARDDRDVIGDAMVMTEEQKRFAATLQTGYAIAFHQGQDGPILVKVDKSPYTERTVSDAEVKALPPGLPTPLCEQVCSIAQRDRRCEPRRRDQVMFSLSEGVRCAFVSLVIGALEVPTWLPTGLTHLNQQLAHSFTFERSGHETLWDCALVHLSYEWFTRLGDGRGWPFDQVRQMAGQFCALVRRTWTDGAQSGGQEWHEWHQAFSELCSLDVGPYPGCRHCSESYRCRYREAVQRVGLTSSNLDMLLHALRQDSLVSADQAGQGVRDVCYRAAREVCDALQGVVHRLAVCFAVQAGAKYRFAAQQQEFLTEYVARRGSEEISQD